LIINIIIDKFGVDSEENKKRNDFPACEYGRRANYAPYAPKYSDSRL
jgi:hypothetical protein